MKKILYGYILAQLFAYGSILCSKQMNENCKHLLTVDNYQAFNECIDNQAILNLGRVALGFNIVSTVRQACRGEL